MLGKVFGGPLVQLVEYDRGNLLLRSKKELKLGQALSLRVAGSRGRPARVKTTLLVCRPIELGGFACAGKVEDAGHCRELSRLHAYSSTVESGMRKSPRWPREINIDCADLKATSVDVSAGGMQVRSIVTLSSSQTLNLDLMPGLSCQARVAWVQGDRAGLEFCQDDAVTTMLLERFANGRAAPTAPPSRSRRTLIKPPDYDSLGE